MAKFKITQITNYDVIELEILMGIFEGSEEEMERVANQNLTCTLQEDGLHLICGGKHSVLADDSDKYSFFTCVKELPPPIDISTLSEEELLALLDDERYMISDDDFVQVDWNLSTAYNRLKSSIVDKDSFSFSSIAYRIEKIAEL